MRIVSISEITNMTDYLNDDQKSTFKDQDITPLIMEPGDTLWRFISQKNKNKFSDFWIDSETMGAIMSIFRSWDDYSERTKKEVVKNNLAILNEWSKLSWRIKITFRKDTVAYKGKTGPQKQFDKNKIINQFGMETFKAIEHRCGGQNQYVIPRFKGIGDLDADEFAEITHFSRL